MKDFEGKLAIPFSYCDINGHTISLDNYQGTWLLMVFHRHLG
jgi:peroxiredoxin